MPFLIAGLLIVWLASLGLRGFLRANPARMAVVLRQAGGLVAFLAGVFLLLRGRIDIAIGLWGLAYWLIRGRWLGRPGGRGIGGAFSGFTRPQRPRVSRVRSAVIEMELDHASGLMTGTVLAGPDEGTSLERMGWQRCLSLYRRCRVDDPEGARLLEAYFDRRFTGWRVAEDEGADPRGGGGGPAGGPRRASGTMSEDEAHEVLGLAKRASREEITRAHRALMKKLHPDHGGSTDLAARVNEAKDVLLRRHP